MKGGKSGRGGNRFCKEIRLGLRGERKIIGGMRMGVGNWELG